MAENAQPVLKKTYRRSLYALFGANVLVFWIAFVGDVALDDLKAWKGLVLFLSPFLPLLVDGLVPSDVKAILVFWRFRNPLPGSEAFSKHINRDPRIDVARLRQSLGALPEAPREQNALWYKLLRRHESVTQVAEAHRVFLFARDSAVLSALLLLVLGPAALALGHADQGTAVYVVLLTCEFLAFATAARNLGVRLVKTVLAVASTDE